MEVPLSSIPNKNLSPKEFCERHNCSLSHFYNLLAAGKLTALKDGKKTIITPEEAARYQASLPAMVSRAKPPKPSRAA
jgi:excisionase family DNA binding protein